MKPKVVQQHANEVQPERCVVRLFKNIYQNVLEMLRVTKCFILHQRNSANLPIGKSTLRNVVSNLCKEAGMEGYKTNHSVRATACSLALSMDVLDKLIMDRTGHKSITSLHTYQRVSEKDKESLFCH